MAAIALTEFAPDQPAAQVDAALRQALDACDRARECAVLWFAEVQRRSLYRQLGHASLQLYATQSLGFSDNRYWQFKRLADDLDRLPALKEAVAAGDLGWTKAQQVARVATPATQAAWVDRAKVVGRRELGREVSAARAARRAPREVRLPQLDLLASAAPAAAAAPASITLRADALQLARFEALLEKARKLRALPATADRLDIVLAGLEALVGRASEDRKSPHAAPVQVVVQRCPDCAAASVVTGRGERRLAPAQVAALACDAKVRAAGKPNRATVPPSVRAAVLARDRYRCTVPGCGSTLFLEVHHLTPRQRGGSNRAENLVTLCSRCHQFAHEQAAHAAGLAPAQVVRRAAPPDGEPRRER
jgi:5-methylcytosine-specific restriction endonuclease McrA